MQSKMKLLLKRSEGTGYYNDWLNIVLTKDFVLNTLQLMIKLELSQILKEKYLNNTEKRNLRYLYRITKSKPAKNCDVNHFLSVCAEVKRITCVKHFSCNFYSLSRSHIPKRETNEWVHLLDCVILTRWSIFCKRSSLLS